MSTPPICVRCGRPVTANPDLYEVFERMHWLCFHLEKEHEGDPDVACDDPTCPWVQIAVFRKELVALGQDPDAAMQRFVDGVGD